jgi:hypothetical protein
MTAIAIILVFLGLCVLAGFSAPDSRFDRPGRQI